MIDAHKQYLTISGTEVNALAMTLAGGAQNSDAIKVKGSVGYSALLAVLADTPDITVTLQCSNDGTNFYDPIDADQNALGAVVTNLTASKWISTYIPLCEYVRYVITPNANSTVTLVHIHKERIGE